MQPRSSHSKATAHAHRGTRLKGITFLMAVLLPAVVMAQPRDPLWVLLSDNSDVGLPRFETGASYTCDPAATSPAEIPAEVMASPRAGGLGRLQDAGRPIHQGSPALGWKAAHAEVVFNLKRSYRVCAVELLLVAGSQPEAVQIATRPSSSVAWQPAGALRNPTGQDQFWKRIVFDSPQNATQVRIALDGKAGGFQVSEARIWGSLDEADPARLPPIAGGERGGELTLVAAGKAQSVIVVGAHPALKTMASARLLQDMLFRMTGTLLPVVERLERTDVARLLVGPIAAAEAGVSIPQTYPDNEHFTLRRIGRDVVIAGNDVSPDPDGDPDINTASGKTPGRSQDPTGFYGTMTGVCAFLELQGARFYRWDDVAKYLITPRQATIRVTSLDRTERPAFIRRSQSARPQTYTPGRELWRIWNRIGGVEMAYSHNDVVSAALYSTHPEYFSLIKGKRAKPVPRTPWQPCISNPAVIRMASDQAAEQFGSRPGLRSYSLSPRDNTGFCECSSCVGLGDSASDRWAAFANAVRRDFDQRHAPFADRKLIFYAYWALSSPPQQVKLVPGVQVMFIGDGCHAHTWQSPHADCSNHKMLEKLAGWKAASPAEPVLIYDWYIPATGSGTNSLQWQNFPWYISAKSFIDARFWQKQGSTVANVEIDGLFDKLSLHWLPYYMVARATWDPSLSGDQMLQDLCRTLYGAGSQSMVEFFKLMERSLTEADVHSRTWRLPDPGAVYPAARRQEIADLLAQAVHQTSSDAMARARVMDVVSRWQAGWKALIDLKAPKKDVEMYNPEVGK